DPAVRSRLDRELQLDGPEVLHARLQQVDPASAARIHRNDPQRIQRALEVYELTGQPLSALHARGRVAALPYRWIKAVLAPADRARMQERITRRFHAMLDAGLIAEVRVLFERGDLHAELPALRAVGYRQVWSWLAGQITYDEMINQAIVATRQYAKRQLTWLRGEEQAQWFAAEDVSVAEQIQKYLQQRLKQSKITL
ncbi:MAG: tRNA (adenosine(37)-N6)-dimethylallyltransferase MiaA, partial [Gammaproteobacteria bacterium]